MDISTDESVSGVENRRPIKARASSWSRALAGLLIKVGLTPNQVSTLSAVCASAAAGFMLLAPHAQPILQAFLLMLAALFVQLRLLCNLLDGLMAIEGGKQSALGDLFNEFPDRVSDSVILVAAGYASGCDALGWLCALLALGSAYVRAFGAQCTGKQDFSGPMAKQHRMFVITVALLVSALSASLGYSTSALPVGLTVVAAGTAITCLRRTLNLARALQ